MLMEVNMRICENGVYRDATPEEIEAFDNAPAPGTQDDISAEEAIEILFGGDAE